MLGNIRRDRLNTDRRAPMASGETIKSLRQSPVVHNFLDPNRHHLTTFCERVFQIGGSAFWHRSHSARFGQTSTTQTIDHPDNRRLSFAAARIDWLFWRCGHAGDGNKPEKSFSTVWSRGWETTRVETRQNGTTNPGNRHEIWRIRSKSPHRKEIRLMDVPI
jgi:hypothetical protein